MLITNLTVKCLKLFPAKHLVSFRKHHIIEVKYVEICFMLP